MNSPRGQAPARTGLVFAFGAYFLWGLLPLYFTLLGSINGFEITAWRVILTVILCALIVTVTRMWPSTIAVFRDRGAVLRLGLAAALIFVNWTVFVIASTSGHILETSLGYFVNPVVTILLGVIFLGERLSWVQWTAVGVTVIAFVVIAVGYGAFPWTSLALAFSFGLYGFVKKKLGGRVGAIQGLTVETTLALPIAGVVLLVVGATGGLTVFDADSTTLIALSFGGVATAVPLLLFAAAARRLPLTTLGFTQYLAPTMSFLFGWLVFSEPMPAARWIGFGLVWLSLILVTIDAIARSRRSPQPDPAPATGPIVLGSD